MRILLWHGYLLGGTGSNVYSRALAREWRLAGHDVTVVCQERHPELYDLGGAPVVRPELPDGLLPVFVLDRYEGLEARLLQDFSEDECARYVEANAAVLRELAPADLVFTNHVLMGAPVGAASGLPFRVKAHGSELEYSMRGRPRLEAWGAETLARAEATYVGSAHIREVVEQVVGPVAPCFEVPPGVDVGEWVPEPRAEALANLVAESRADPPNPGNANERLPDEGNADRLAAFFAEDGPVVVYFGKLIVNKGVHLLLDAIRGLDVRAVVVGFGDHRRALEQQARTCPGADALHRAARAPPPRASAAARRGVGRAVDLPRGVRHGRGRGGVDGLPAARRAPLRAWPRSRPGSRPSTRRGCATWPRSSPATSPTCGRSSSACSRCPTPTARRCASRRRAVVAALVVDVGGRAPARARRLTSHADGGNLRAAWARNRSSPPTSSSRSRATRSRTEPTSRSPSRRSSRSSTRGRSS